MSLELANDSESLRETFYALETPRDVARLLDVRYNQLIYHLHKTDPKFRYETFKLPKRSGGFREISAPVTPLKIIQRKLNQVLQVVYPGRPQVHGFVRGKSILTNARSHSSKQLVLKVDLQDFFPTINFGRTRGMFLAHPYNRNAAVSTILAQICCFENRLPQGAPTSPIVSNMVCAKLDSGLLKLAKRIWCTYTRYADDLTFSTSRRHFPPFVAAFSTTSKQVEVGPELRQIIQENLFQINEKKVRLLQSHKRQMVTGLVTNKFPNVTRKYMNQVRAMLYAWETYGLQGAEQHFYEKHYRKHRSSSAKIPSFEKVIQGKIEFLGHIRGRTNTAYIKFLTQLHSLAPHLVKGAIAKPKELHDEQKGHWFPIKPIDKYQLTLDIEDNLGIRLLPDTESQEVDGYLKIYSKTVNIELCVEDKAPDTTNSQKFCRRILTPKEEDILRSTYETHIPRELTFQGEMAQVVTRYSPSVGRIVVCHSTGVQKFATGFLVLRRNLLLTAAHVVDPEILTVEHVEFEKEQVRCKILHLDNSLDVALLELEHEVAARPIKIRQSLRMPTDRGMHCVTIGFPDEPGYVPRSVPVELSITDITGNYILKQEVLTLSRSLGSGTSGSPILNKNRSLVGMVIGFPSEQEEEEEGEKKKNKQKQKWTAAAVSCNDLATIINKYGALPSL